MLLRSFGNKSSQKRLEQWKQSGAIVSGYLAGEHFLAVGTRNALDTTVFRLAHVHMPGWTRVREVHTTNLYHKNMEDQITIMQFWIILDLRTKMSQNMAILCEAFLKPISFGNGPKMALNPTPPPPEDSGKSIFTNWAFRLLLRLKVAICNYKMLPS